MNFYGVFMPNEDYAIVLDYLPKGPSAAFKSEPIAQVLGTRFFTLLEVSPKVELKLHEKVYIGKDKRDQIDFIKRRIDFKELTSTASAELEKAIEQVVLEEKQVFLDFFNNSKSISLRMHQLELLPGLGQKHTADILSEREKKPFESFEDLIERIKLMPNPVKIVVKRVLEELEDSNLKHYLFVRPPLKHEFEKRDFRQNRFQRDFRRF